MSAYQTDFSRAASDPEGFWAEEARSIDWFRPYRQVLDREGHVAGRWFPGGALNACHEALDRHVAAGREESIALIHDSAMTGRIERISYGELRDRVAELAGYLTGLGTVPGDRVLIYMPMVPEAAIAMLACARIGAVHCVVFGGFGSRELAARIDHATPRVILTASCGLEPGRIVAYKPLLDEALGMARHRPQCCLVLQRAELIATLEPGRDLDWAGAVRGAKPAPCIPVDSNHPLYVLYTSGTTGMPKGVVRDTAGYVAALRYSMRAVYDVRPGEVFWAASDIGWVVGHSYTVYAPLFIGCTTVMYEGKPVGTPDAAAFWRVVSRHRVSALFTAPTAIRAIKREDPDCRLIRDFDVSCLRALFLAGEHADADTIRWAAAHLQRPVLDHWWQTETGWPVAANCCGLEAREVRLGSVSVPVPGYDVRVVDEHGVGVPPGTSGAIVVRLPLPPGCLTGLWDDPDGLRRAYLAHFPGHYNTGDGGYFDADGYLYVMGRLDDVINVAGHRLSTGEIEEVIAEHPDIAECAVIPLPDEIKGAVPVAIVVPKRLADRPAEALRREVVDLVRHGVGPVASLRICVVVARLPKTRSGKILRSTMRRMAARESWTAPPTIEDPAVLDDLALALGRLIERNGE